MVWSLRDLLGCISTWRFTKKRNDNIRKNKTIWKNSQRKNWNIYITILWALEKIADSNFVLLG
jgi:hypothetical protein